MSTSAAGKWIREILKHGPNAVPDDVDGQTSHGLKATTLSWVAKHGSLSTYDRRILGYHMIQEEGSMHCYSRDVVSASIRKYESVLQAIATGAFDPDTTRSGYFKKDDQLGRTVTKEPKCRSSKEVESRDEDSGGWNLVRDWELAKDADSNSRVAGVDDRSRSPALKRSSEVQSSDESGSDSGSSSDSADSDEDVLLKDLMPACNLNPSQSRRPASKSGAACFVHSRLKTLHALGEHSLDRLACGRRVHDGFRALEEGATMIAFPKCSICFGKAG